MHATRSRVALAAATAVSGPCPRKWGIAGLLGSVAKEVALFTLMVPRPAGTDFGLNLIRSTPMPVYDGAPCRSDPTGG